MITSKYLSRFAHLTTEGAASFDLIGDHILVERIPVTEKRTSSGLILSLDSGKDQKNSLSADLPIMVIVVAVGKGYYNDDTGASVPLNVKPGDIGLVGSVSTKWFSDLPIGDYKPYEIGLSREEEIKWLFKGLEGYERAFDLLNSGIKAQVEQGQ